MRPALDATPAIPLHRRNPSANGQALLTRTSMTRSAIEIELVGGKEYSSPSFERPPLNLIKISLPKRWFAVEGGGEGVWSKLKIDHGNKDNKMHV